MTEGMKQRLVGIMIILAAFCATALGMGTYMAYKADAFFSEVLYKDNGGAILTRKDVLRAVAQGGLQQMLQNAAKEQQKAAPAPQSEPPAPEK